MDLRNRLREQFPVLESERLRLRKIEREDAELLFACVNDPLVRRHSSFRQGTLLFPDRLFRYFDETYQSLRDLHFGIERKNEKGLIGICSLQFWDREAGRARLGYLLAPSRWNRGLATEAARSVVQFGFDTLRLSRIEARCSIHNPASERVLRKCGFAPGRNAGGRIQPDLEYGSAPGDEILFFYLSKPASICYTNEIYL
ncbi:MULTISPECIES: GNAT family N-acetyltransferase [Paenibacillus]|uniref:GNAT family N-acetyltransferase n=1 Tax=Paenibacillus TaxID=44249 RepID=UPI002FE34F46